MRITVTTCPVHPDGHRSTCSFCGWDFTVTTEAAAHELAARHLAVHRAELVPVATRRD